MTALIDTGFLYALLDADDRNHAAADQLYRASTEPRILVSSVLPEAAYLIGTRLSYEIATRFIRGLARSTLQFEMVTQADLARVAEIMEQYADARLDFVDCTLMAVAERMNVSRVWTFDRRDFSIMRPRHASHFELLP